MGDDKGKSPFVSISVVAVMLAALGVTMFVQPFKGSRPFIPEYRESYEKINARLWQDPFQAVLDSAKADQTPSSAGQLDLCNEAGSKRKEIPFASPHLEQIEDTDNVTLLAVMVPGGPYFEDAESRMRYRYALLSGLNRVGFVSEDAQHVEFIKIGSLDNKITLTNIVPIEWVELGKDEEEKNDKKDSVLVLWINEGLFEETPLSKLACLVEYIKKRDKLHKAKFKVIGPATSGTLKEMVREASSGGTPNRTGALEGAEIYSALATVDNVRLLKGATGEGLAENDARDEIKKRFESHKIKLIRTIGTDKALVDQLIQELNRRRVDLRRANHILLVAEWDTFYGRSFKDLFNEALKKNDGVSGDEIGRRIHFISYLRGIDGVVPGEKGDQDKVDGKPEAKSDPLNDIKKLEQPVGKSQYDYLRRLAEATYDLNETLRARKPSEEIRAIGVMGSDFYDKYLVLQAFRQWFPGVIYFTTDLDARFLHPDNIRWTRNLVVASNFNLSLRRDYQGEAPPFRDNYQTSIFLTVLLAFPDKWSYLNKDVSNHLNDLLKKEPGENGLSPLIFEIGRHKAVGLTDPGDAVHPPRDRTEHGTWLYGRIALIIALGLMVIFFAGAPVNNFVKQILRAKAKYRVMSVGGLLLLVGCGYALYYAVYEITRLPDEEPFSVLEGISVWPTELLRLLAVLLSILFLYLSRRSREINRKLIDEEFAKGEYDGPLHDNDARTGHEKPTHGWRHMVAMVTELDWNSGETKKSTKLRDVWLDYVSHDLDRYRIVRVAIILVLYILFCYLIVSGDMPMSPARGRISSLTDKAVLSVSSILLVVLIFYVLDVTRCCRRFIALASEKISALNQSGENKRDQVKNELDLIRLIAARTETIGKLIFYPFIVWLIMFVARFDYFDNWKTPPELAVVISLGAVLAWSCAFLLRRSAESVRTCVVGRLSDSLRAVKADDNPSPAMIAYIEFVLDQVRSVRQGAFTPFTQHPVLQSLLVPFGGVGGVYLVDFLAKMNF